MSELTHNPEFLTAVLESIAEGVIIASPDGDLMFTNAEAERILGMGIADPPSPRWPEQFGVFADDRVTPIPQSTLVNALFGAGRQRATIRFFARNPCVPEGMHIDARIRPVFSGLKFLGVVVVMRDMTPHKRTEQELAEQARRDGLTGLLNRKGFDDAVAAACEHPDGFALVYIDVDGLKRANDMAGHAVGDQLIAAAAATLNRTFRTTDAVARVGGDEFCVLLPGVDDVGVQVACQRLQEAVDAVNMVGNVGWPLSLSTGWAVREPGSDMTADDVVAAADAAMYARRKARRKPTRSVMAAAEQRLTTP